MDPATSGTTGLPKMLVHTLSSLARAIKAGGAPETRVIWSTVYDNRRYRDPPGLVEPGRRSPPTSERIGARSCEPLGL
jgi:hypothetical protein